MYIEGIKELAESMNGIATQLSRAADAMEKKKVNRTLEPNRYENIGKMIDRYQKVQNHPYYAPNQFADIGKMVDEQLKKGEIPCQVSDEEAEINL